MLRRGYGAVAVAVFAVAVTLLASASTGPFFGAVTKPGISRRDQGPLVGQSAGSGGRPDEGVWPRWLQITAIVLLGAYALALLVLAISHRRGRRDAELPTSPDADAEPTGDDWTGILAVELGDAAELALDQLGEGTPRNAIVACWMGLQTATAHAGLPEVASDTAVEYTVRAMQGLELDATAINDFALLYREARFSAHPMTEQDRAAAGIALRVLAGDLAHRRPLAAGRPTG